MALQIVPHNHLYCIRIDPPFVDLLKEIDAIWHPKWKCWTVVKNLPRLRHLVALAENSGSQIHPSTWDLLPKQDEADLPGITRMTPRPYQKRAWAFIKDLKGSFLHMEMGTGKTLVGLGALIERGQAMNLIVAPKEVVPIWAKAFAKMTDKNFIIVSPKKSHSTEQAAKAAEEGHYRARVFGIPFVLILNYEKFWRGNLKRFILKQNWGHIIYDEAHKLKSPDSTASKFAKLLYNRSEFRIGLTGTPMTSSPLDYYAQFRAIDQTVFGTSNAAYKAEYTITNPQTPHIARSYKNLDKLRRKVQSISFRVTKAEVLPDLPPQIHNRLYVEMPASARKIYDQLKKEAIAEIKEGTITVANAAVKLLRLQQVASGHTKTEDGQTVTLHDEKAKALQDFSEDFYDENGAIPLIVFCKFSSDIAQAKKALAAKGRKVAELSGQVRQLAEWQNGRYDDIVVQIQAGSAGIDLTRGHNNIYYSHGFSYGDYDQSVSRTHRDGQRADNVFYTHILAENTVDEKIIDAIEGKKNIAEYILETIMEEEE